MLKVTGLALALMLAITAPTARAAEALPEVSLSASAQRRVTQDWLILRLSIKRDGSDGAALQAQLKQGLQQALTAVQGLASGDALQVQTGGFHLVPRYNSAGAAMGWRGSAELILRGSDFGLIGRASARLGEMTVDSVELGVSQASERRVREQVRLEAIAAFRDQAASVAKAFGYNGYELVDVNVGSDRGSGGMPIALRSAGPAAAPLPVAAAQEEIVVNVSGRIRLQ